MSPKFRYATCHLRLILVLAVVFASTSLSGQTAIETETFVVRTHSDLRKATVEGPAELLRAEDVGETYCQSLHCTVIANTPSRRSALSRLKLGGLVSFEPLPDAQRVFFRGATLDVRSGLFDADFPGKEEPIIKGEFGLFAVVFKAHPEERWVRTMSELGLQPLESLQTMAYQVYGPRSVATRLPDQLPFIRTVAEIPVGLKRVNLDHRIDGDGDEPDATSVLVVASRREVVLRALETLQGYPPRLEYSTGTLESYTAHLGRMDAIALSVLPEVVSIARRTQPPVPSDERANRIIAGVFQSPGTSWPTFLPSNSGAPFYWNGYLSSLTNLGNGFDLSNQTIGIVDTGIDSGLRRNSQDYCPPFLQAPGYPCRLIFVSDVTQGSDETRGDDRVYHGTMVASIAAGFASSASPGRDNGTSGYSFTQGVAQNAKVALSQFWNYCASYRSEGEAQPFYTNGYYQKLRYALLGLTSAATMPDVGPGASARIINHSWNRSVYDYDDSAELLDQTARSLHYTWFTFGNGQTLRGPAESGALHVVSAGNFPRRLANGDPDPNDLRLITAPATAKNVLTVGSTEQYNQQAWTAGCDHNNADNADNPRQITAFSRTGFSNQRLKPDLVAPGTRMYGWRSVENGSCGDPCNSNLDGSGNYAWIWGTSYSAPVVAGAAAVTREWLRTLGYANASPALLKAALICGARSISNLPACSSGCTPCCSDCGDVRPAPDKYQGWGGVSLDRFFRPPSNYFIQDQSLSYVFPYYGPSYSRTLVIADPTKDINIALVWTDRAGGETANPLVNLVNDLNLSASITSGSTYSWYGNNFYTSIDSCSRNGYSLRNPPTVEWDHKNNVEKISIKATDIPTGATQITVNVTPFSLTGDGIDPIESSPHFRQDFALFVENARQ